MTLTYTCTHTHSIRLSTCRGVFPIARDKSLDAPGLSAKKKPKPGCLSSTTIALKSFQPCGVCQHATFEQEKTARLSEAQATLNAALERVVQAHDLEDKGFGEVIRARRTECERLREELERLEEEYVTKTWAMEIEAPSKQPLKGKRTVKKGERMHGGSMLKCEVRADVVSVDENDGWERGTICDELKMSASDEYELEALPLTALAITEEARRQIDATNAEWYEAFSTTDTGAPTASEADGETEIGIPTMTEEEP